MRLLLVRVRYSLITKEIEQKLPQRRSTLARGFKSPGLSYFESKEILPKKCLIFFHLQSMQLFSSDPTIFSKNISNFFAHENMKKTALKSCS